MTTYYCQGPLCDPEGRAVSDRDPGVPEREAELIRGGQLYMCRACAAERLAGDIDDPDPAPETVPELLDALAAAVQRARARKTTSKETR